MLFLFEILVLTFSLSFAHQDPGTLPGFFGRYLGGLTADEKFRRPPVTQSSSAASPAPTQQYFDINPFVKIKEQQQPTSRTVYGPLSANWSSCPNGFDCCDHLVYADPMQILECCESKAYDRRYHFCVQGKIQPLSPRNAKGTNRVSPPTPLSRLNCGGFLYVAVETFRCCSFDVYDPEVQQCNDGTVEDLPKVEKPTLPFGSVYIVCGNYRYIMATGASLTWGCCGQDLYNYNTENCTNSGVLPTRTPEIQSQVPLAQGLLVFCSGVRYWVDPASLSTIRCCGTRLCSAMYGPSFLKSN